MPRPRTCPARFHRTCSFYYIERLLGIHPRCLSNASSLFIRGTSIERFCSLSFSLSLSLSLCLPLRLIRIVPFSLAGDERRTTNDRERTTARAGGRQVYRAENTTLLPRASARRMRETEYIGCIDYRT